MSKDRYTDKHDIFLRGARLWARQDARLRRK